MLNPTNQDKTGIVLANYDGTADAENYPLGDKPEPSGDATLLFQETFESTLQPGSSLDSGSEVVENEPYAGNKCCRVNLKNSANDPFVTTPANNATYSYRGSVLAQETAPEIMTIRFRFRFDDATWDGTGGETKNSPSQVEAKAGYWGPAGQIVSQGFYPVFIGGTNGDIRFADNGCAGRGDCGWDDEPWAVQGRTIFYLQTGTNWGAGTGWHLFEIVIDRTHPDYAQVKLSIDGVTATNGSYAADGIMRVPKTWYVEEFSTTYTSGNNTDLSVDRTETACGIQIDNVEIYDGEPA